MKHFLSCVLIVLQVFLIVPVTPSSSPPPPPPPRFRFYHSDTTQCGFAARTWMTLIELGLPFELIKVNVRAKPDWYRRISPKGKVPALVNVDDDTTVYESSICNEYLVDLVQQSGGGNNGRSRCALMPTDPSDRARVRLFNDHVDTAVIPTQYAFLMNKDSDKDAELSEAFAQALSTLENRLKEEGGPYLMGNDFTLADIHFLPFYLRARVSLRHFKDYDMGEERFPYLYRWYEVCSQRECCRVAGKSEKQLIDFYTSYMQWQK